MAKRPSKKAPAEDTGLLAALKFVALAQHDVGTVYQTHCRFTQMNNTGYVVAFDGILAAGHPVQEEIPICPHTHRLINALERVAGAVSMTALDTKQLAIKSDKFRALVSCIGDGDLTYAWPDPPQWPLNDAFKVAANIASTFNTEGGQTVMQASIVTRDQSLIGTTGLVVIEAWHGIPTPPGMIIPVSFVKALNKVTKPITRFGFSEGSLTVFFEGDAWLKTQLYQEQFPNVDKVLAYTETAKPVPLAKDVIEGIKAVQPFAETPQVWLGNGKVHSHDDPEQGAAFEAKNAVASVSLNSKNVLALADIITQIDYTGNDTVIPFFGDKVRGAFARYRD